jgi:predicted ABC-class ATPase
VALRSDLEELVAVISDGAVPARQVEQ